MVDRDTQREDRGTWPKACRIRSPCTTRHVGKEEKHLWNRGSQREDKEKHLWNRGSQQEDRGSCSWGLSTRR
ncbi:hypothetical protein AMTRI_Chr04g185860 [Amborella trichopoda]